MKGITLCADCAYYNMKKHKCTRGCKIDPDVSKGENPSFYVDCPLPDVEPVQKWIPCSERMPEIRTPVLIYDKHHKAFFVAKLDEDYFGFSSNMWHHPADVPFWMPLPEAPREDRENA